MDDVFEFMKIPKMRIGALVGKNGETKKKIESELKCRINISPEGEVEFASKDPLLQFKLKGIIKAIGRGFTYDEAILLTDDDYMLEVINLKDFALKSEKTMMRYKSRIIGAEGKSRKMIEDLSDTKLVVFGKTASIIGKFEDVETAKEAVQMLIDGATHRNVRVFLEKRARERRAYTTTIQG